MGGDGSLWLEGHWAREMTAQWSDSAGTQEGLLGKRSPSPSPTQDPPSSPRADGKRLLLGAEVPPGTAPPPFPPSESEGTTRRFKLFTEPDASSPPSSHPTESVCRGTSPARQTDRGCALLSTARGGPDDLGVAASPSPRLPIYCLSHWERREEKAGGAESLTEPHRVSGRRRAGPRFTACDPGLIPGAPG